MIPYSVYEGFLDEGRHFHDCLKRSCLALDVALGNAFICMYGKCGSMQEAHAVFDSMPQSKFSHLEHHDVSMFNNGWAYNQMQWKALNRQLLL